MTREQLDVFLTELEAQFPGYYPNAKWNTGVVIPSTITAVNGSTYYNEDTNLLFTYTTSWDAGVSIPDIAPVSPFAPDAAYFDETTDTLYRSIPDWDLGVVLPVAQPADLGTLIGNQWFNEGTDTLYTAVSNDTWVGATTEVLPVVLPVEPLVGDQWFNESSNTLFTNLENVWDAGILTDTITNTTYFDETNNLLFTYTTSWDAGVAVPTNIPARPLNGDQWFDEDTNTLYTYIDEAGWLALEQVAVILLANNENIYPDRTLQANFDDTYEIMYLRTGEYNDAGSFINTKVISAINYALIAGIELYRLDRMKSAYKLGRQV